MTARFTHASRTWGVAFLGVLGLTGYRATHAAPEASAGASYEGAGPVLEPQRRVLNRSDELGIPYRLATVGPWLVVIDVASDEALHAIDRETGELTRSFGRRGEGPGEFKEPWSLDPVAGSSSELWVYDYRLRRLSYVDLRDEFFAQERLGERSVRLQSSASLTGVMRTNDNGFVGPGFFQEGRLGVFEEHGKLIGKRGRIPEVDREVPPLLRQYMYQSTTAAHPDHDRLAVASRYASALEIYRPDGSLIAMADAPFPIAPDAKLVSFQHGFVQEDDTPLGYVEVAASGDYVFALFSGRTFAEYKGREMFARDVHVFDWEGALRGVVRLEVDVVSLAVDRDSQSLYVVEHDPVPTVAEYDLADIGLTPSR